MTRSMAVCIGIIGTGEMGSGVGGFLAAHGADVRTSLHGRSAASDERVRATGMTVVDGLGPLARECALVLSIVPPERALAVAEEFAGALHGSGASPLYVDCNAIAPQTARAVGEIVTAAGARYVDASIIGASPSESGKSPRFHACGPCVEEFVALQAYGLVIFALAGEIGIASALKMCWAGIGKAYIGIGAAMFEYAEKLGIAGELMAEFNRRPKTVAEYLPPETVRMYRKAYRWVGEMHEIAAFSADFPAVSEIYTGLAGYYGDVAQRP
jgi:3-hydroxyisobutyrate dehydrogenase-like beta-hydroxyacid dehydrogenase